MIKKSWDVKNHTKKKLLKKKFRATCNKTNILEFFDFYFIIKQQFSFGSFYYYFFYLDLYLI